jgi:Ca2+-binding RTX toxin-like protein
MSNLTVGPGQQYSTLTAAIAASHNGDVIQVAAGTYTNDFPAVIADDITIEGVGGMANFVATKAPPNGKAILVTNGNDTIENLSFSGAQVADGNGAGIKVQAGSITLINDYFHNNQDGVLTGDGTVTNVTIENSEFDHNGTSSGKTHNIYVGQIAGTLTIDNSLFMNAVVGHEIKSDAHSTIIENSRIFDGPTGTASYSVDLPYGGNAVIKNNIIEQGPLSQNAIIVHYGGAPGAPYAGSSLDVTGNTVLNDLNKPAAYFVYNQTTSVTANITGNMTYGLTPAQIAFGPATVSGNTTLATEPALDTSPPFTTGGGTSSVAANELALLNPAIPHPDASLFTVTTGATAGQKLTGTAADDMLIGTATNQVLTGGKGFDVLVGGPGTEQLVGGPGTTDFLGGSGNNNLVAGAGTNYMQAGTGHDTFTFHYGPSGNSAIYGFDATLDHLVVLLGQSVAQVTAASLASGTTADASGDAVIHLATTQVTLEGVAPSQVNASWFTVHA